jgi:uncharacterized protein
LFFSSISRRKFLRLSAAAGVIALGADSTLIEPNRPQVVRQDIALKRWPARLEGFTIALLSDFHYDPYFSSHPLKAAIAMTRDLHPDLIALTGDFVSVPLLGTRPSGADHVEACAQLLKQLHAPHGVWAVLGNHDVLADPSRVSNALTAQGIGVLANQSLPIEKDGERFWLSGVDDVLFGAPDLDATLAKVPGDEAVVLMAHEPDFADYVAGHRVDLQLSGHTHGGQVKFPFLPPLFLPDLARKYVRGLFHIRDLTLYTNIGIGTVRIPIRFNCPPEITLLRIRQGSPA